jgi:ABC-type multidrug transport system permease subunit
MTKEDAFRAYQRQQVAAVMVIPQDFDARVARAEGGLDLYLNNVSIDLADDLRRSSTRAIAELDAPQLGIVGERSGPSQGLLLPNPYRVAVAERDLRETEVSFLAYQTVPILILVVISVGMLGTALLSARDFERKTAKLLLLSPHRRGTLVLGRALGGVIVTGAALLPLLLLGVATRVLAPPPSHWPALLALLFAVTVMAVGLGLLLGVTVRENRLVTMVGLNVSNALFFLGGGFTTVAFLPRWLEGMSRVVPTSYAIRGLRQALFYPDLTGFFTDLGALLFAAAIALLLGALATTSAWRRA